MKTLYDELQLTNIVRLKRIGNSCRNLMRNMLAILQMDEPLVAFPGMWQKILVDT
jgi:hypothetical protein